MQHLFCVYMLYFLSSRIHRTDICITETRLHIITLTMISFSDLQVTLKGRGTDVSVDSPVDLICTVRGPKTPLSVNWKFMPSHSSTWTNIVSIKHTGEITWRSEQRNYQLSVQIQPSGVNFALRIVRSSRRQGGRYVCQVNTYQKNIQKTSKDSNPLAVTVRTPGMCHLIIHSIKGRALFTCIRFNRG